MEKNKQVEELAKDLGYDYSNMSALKLAEHLMDKGYRKSPPDSKLVGWTKDDQVWFIELLWERTENPSCTDLEFCNRVIQRSGRPRVTEQEIYQALGREAAKDRMLPCTHKKVRELQKYAKAIFNLINKKG